MFHAFQQGSNLFLLLLLLEASRAQAALVALQDAIWARAAQIITLPINYVLRKSQSEVTVLARRGSSLIFEFVFEFQLELKVAHSLLLLDVLRHNRVNLSFELFNFLI